MTERWFYMDIVNSWIVVTFGHCVCLNRGYIWTLFLHVLWLYLDSGYIKKLPI